MLAIHLGLHKFDPDILLIAYCSKNVQFQCLCVMSYSFEHTQWLKTKHELRLRKKKCRNGSFRVKGANHLLLCSVFLAQGREPCSSPSPFNNHWCHLDPIASYWHPSHAIANLLRNIRTVLPEKCACAVIMFCNKKWKAFLMTHTRLVCLTECDACRHDFVLGYMSWFWNDGSE